MDIVEQLERNNGKPLEEEERAEVELWQKGRALSHQVNAPGWDVVLEILQNYVTQNINQILNTDPGNKDEVLATHAVAFAASRIYRLFREDVANAIEASKRTPECLKEGLRKVSPVPPEFVV